MGTVRIRRSSVGINILRAALTDLRAINHFKCARLREGGDTYGAEGLLRLGVGSSLTGV